MSEEQQNSAAQEAQPAEAQPAETQPAEAQSTDAQPEETQQVAGVALIIAAFQNEDAANQALKKMKQAKKEGSFYYEAAATIKKDADGDLHYHETGDMSTGKGAGIGALVGGLVGILGGPLGIALGAGAGAAIGGIAAHGDAGFRDSSLEQIGTALRPGSSAVMVITDKKFLQAFRKQVSDADLWPMVRAIGESISRAQLQGQDMLIGIVLTEQGVSVQRLAYDESTVEIFGMAATDDGVAVGGAYADESGVIYQVGVSDEEGDTVQTGVVTEAGAVIVNESTPAGSDETTVTVYQGTPQEAQAELSSEGTEEPAKDASEDQAAPAEEAPEEDKPAEEAPAGDDQSAEEKS